MEDSKRDCRTLAKAENMLVTALPAAMRYILKAEIYARAGVFWRSPFIVM
ncbi:hypothetical protein [Nostoc sp.]